KNVPFYTAYLRAGNHGDSVSDKGSSGFASLNDYYRCLQIMRPGDPLVYREWLLRSGRFITLSDITYEKQAWLTLPWLHQQPQPSTNEPLPALPAKTHVFRDTGIALLFNQTTNLDSAVRAAFHSRPYGVVGHGHPGNNTFNLTYGGKPVFTGTGHYSESYDRFALRNYKHSRAKNGILPYGNVCEGLDTSGYGWIARHLEGDRISYSLGDASQSFSGSYRIHERNLANAEIPLTLEAGYGNPGVTRYRRHLALLDNGTLVLYDELAAQTAIPWTFQLNSVTPMVKINNHTVASTCPNGFAVAEVFCEQPLQTSITDQFVGDIKDMASLYNRARWEVSNHWHASLAVTNGQQTLRFLTLIHRVQNGQPMVQSVENLSADGRKVVSAGGWSVEAEMDGSRPGYLKIWNSAGTSALVSGPAATNLQLGAAGCTAKLPGSTILMEQGQAVKEAIDVLPDILRYGNIY
ncbi:MAG TPA: heparinase II/III family protein, partial [Pontiellaceae bacterium]|nr:heparinase II/III family protein [Pontiellaceae bacterium]